MKRKTKAKKNNMSDGKTYIDISKLVRWKLNPRKIDETEKAKLRDRLVTLGQFDPLLVTPDDGYNVVIGGNMRLEIMNELMADGYDFKKVWVSLIEFKEEDGKWFAWMDGKKHMPKLKEGEVWDGFTSKLEGMTKYALAHNETMGVFIPEATIDLINISGGMELFADYNVQTGYGTPIATLGKIYEIGKAPSKSKEKEVDEQDLPHKCPKCGFEF